MQLFININKILHPGIVRVIKCLSIAGLVFTLNSCDKNYDPSIETLSSYYIQQINGDQKAKSSEYLTDSIFIQVSNRISSANQKGFKVEFQVITGDGTVDRTEVLTRTDGMAGTRWKLGNKSFTQTVRARTYDLKGEIISELTFSAYAFIPNFWSDVTFYPLSQISDLSADTLNHISWMVAQGKIYKRGTNFLDWVLINNINITNARLIRVDKQGIVYTGTWQNELFKSSDKGQTWVKCTNPIPNRINYFDFWITSDGALWASAPGAGTWHSEDG